MGIRKGVNMTIQDKIRLAIVVMIKKLDDNKLSEIEKDNIIMAIERLEKHILN